MLSFLLTLAGVAAQAPAAAVPALQTQAPSSRYRGRIFISPMGEPFRPSGHDDDTLADWFRQADRNHDGQLTLEEMQQDAERFFATLDLNHDGEIDPDELTHYEEVIAPEVRTGAGFEVAARRNDDHQGGARFGLLDLPEPVASADTNFNRGVSLAEFRAAAQQRFLALDVDHKGSLTLPGLILLRPAPPAAPHEARPSADPQGAAPDSGR